MKANCTGCDAIYDVADNMAGKNARCGKCGTTFVLKSAEVKDTTTPIIPNTPTTSGVAEEWYYVDKQNNQQGGYTKSKIEDLIKKGVITANTQVWNKNMTEWKQAVQTELKPLFYPAIIKGIIILLVIACVVLAFVFTETNPSLDNYYKNKFDTEAKERAREYAEQLYELQQKEKWLRERGQR